MNNISPQQQHAGGQDLSCGFFAPGERGQSQMKINTPGYPGVFFTRFLRSAAEPDLIPSPTF
ncbi:hypothetical protein ACVGWG_03730, partial [Enterobacter asburiae]